MNPGMSIDRLLSRAGHAAASLGRPYDPADDFAWATRHVKVEEKGRVVYEADVEAPTHWSDLAVTVVAKTYFRRVGGVMESSVKALVRRVVDAVAEASKHPDVGTDYFGEVVDRDQVERRAAFRDELFLVVVGQFAAFNTPVWVNVGVAESKWSKRRLGRGVAKAGGGRLGVAAAPTMLPPYGAYGSTPPPNFGPMASACFILGVDDDIESITSSQKTETKIFKAGGGAGSNLSALRPKDSPLSKGGTASGPVSFMRGFDAWAGITKSGGSSRRAALMRILDCYHPDARDFIATKPTVGRIVDTLKAGGWDVGMNSEIMTLLPFQNANNSLRVDDAFMRAATGATSSKISMRFPTGLGVETAGPQVCVDDAAELLDAVAEATWRVGDPGLQFHDAINKWHTCKNSGPIVGSNPCSEFVYLDNTACNLASLRLGRFLDVNGFFDVATFEHVARLVFLAQEILVGTAGYPTQAVADNSRRFRPLGLGYADLGAAIMRQGLAYDSEEARGFCAAVSSLLGGVAYRTSAEIAERCGGAFEGFAENREPMLGVICEHLHHSSKLLLHERPSWIGRSGSQIGGEAAQTVRSVAAAANQAWLRARDLGLLHGYRNAQATVLAPTGSISFMMDCETTGIEPLAVLKTRKKLAGGGVVEFACAAVEPALRRLGYDEDSVHNVVEVVGRTGEIPVSRGGGGQRDHDLSPRHLPVFATAFGQPGNEISVAGHLEMMAAAQPFLSGAISKTCNVSSSYTSQQIRDAYVEAWRLGLKAVAIYRDGSKDQPVESATKTPKDGDVVIGAGTVAVAEEGARRAIDAASAETAQLRHDLDVATSVLQALETFTPQQIRRRRLPDDRPGAHIHKFSLGGVDGFVQLGFYDEARTELGEIFVKMEPKAKAAIAVDLATQAASIALQHGADVHKLLDKWEGTEFAPSGFTGEGEGGVAYASSPLDYLARWLRRFLAGRARDAVAATGQLQDEGGVSVTIQRDGSIDAVAPPTATASQVAAAINGMARRDVVHSAPQLQRCPRCDVAAMARDGACMRCRACGHGEGGCGGG